jgi:hypothetical protein
MGFLTSSTFGVVRSPVTGVVEVRRTQVFQIEVNAEHRCKSTEEMCDHAERMVEAGNVEGPPISEDVEAISF